MTAIKLVALDMDGTLLNDQQEISEQNAYWIQKALDAGVKVCFATGRGFPSAVPYAEQLKLNTPMITVNGGEIWHKPYELYDRTLMSPQIVKQLHQLALQEEECWFWAYTVRGIVNKEKWIGNDYEQHEWLKFGYYNEDRSSLNRILKQLAAIQGLEITNSSPDNIEINPAGISKASAIRKLCAHLGLDISQVAAMGDSLNDIAMIRAAGLGVAVGNAQEEVKAAADHVIVKNNEHAVAHLLEHYVLKGE